ncbi:YqaE/Pmp3 family membrane protein [Pseudalkalibacillus berkeleyi]|uniref:YqaE/Pmp3 family membrane protein n=1 Tax=Pseudalkalibacillus berkeleyi TaxID=1069813 RepID=A0ABS9GWL8_9BACL|nr:YqaE/Pmp3 family membrane protein [Pseudalkalibacillus berkeleyi]MCF6136106.1 YqaE/Pmp3 family membrane protein [Pseudalkalibacillus berkeleyi]
MMYLLALLLPPLAVLFSGSKTQTLINIVLTLIGWLPGVIHAFFVIHQKGSVSKGSIA